MKKINKKFEVLITGYDSLDRYFSESYPKLDKTLQVKKAFPPSRFSRTCWENSVRKNDNPILEDPAVEEIEELKKFLQ